MATSRSIQRQITSTTEPRSSRLRQGGAQVTENGNALDAAARAARPVLTGSRRGAGTAASRIATSLRGFGQVQCLAVGREVPGRGVPEDLGQRLRLLLVAERVVGIAENRESAAA
jgi:hypothetical protein